jgi:hypothetical protein
MASLPVTSLRARHLRAEAPALQLRAGIFGNEGHCEPEVLHNQSWSTCLDLVLQTWSLPQLRSPRPRVARSRALASYGARPLSNTVCTLGIAGAGALAVAPAPAQQHPGMDQGGWPHRFARLASHSKTPATVALARLVWGSSVAASIHPHSATWLCPVLRSTIANMWCHRRRSTTRIADAGS